LLNIELQLYQRFSSREHSSERLGETKIAPINVSSKRARDGTYMISISVEKETNFVMYSSLRVDREPFKLSLFELFDRVILAPGSD